MAYIDLIFGTGRMAKDCESKRNDQYVESRATSPALQGQET